MPEMAEWQSAKGSSLCRQSGVVGVSPGPSSSQVIVTIANDGVSVVDIGVSKSVRSWAFQEEDGALPRGPARYQRGGGGYICIPMMTRSSSVGDETKSRPKKVSSKSASSDFLYVWTVENMDSKTIKHISSKVDLSATVSNILPVRCHYRKIRGDMSLNRKYCSSFIVLSSDGGVSLLDGESGAFEKNVVKVACDSVLDSICEDNSLLMVYKKLSGGKRNQEEIWVSQYRLSEYPSLDASACCKLDLGDHAADSIVDVACRGNSVAVMFENGIFSVYNVSEGKLQLSPVLERHLKTNATGSQAKKRPAAGATSSTGSRSVSIDSHSRAFIIEDAGKAKIRVVCIDLLYGSVLLATCVEREHGAGQAVREVVISGETSVDLCIAFEESSVVHVNSDVPIPSLASVVGALCTQNNLQRKNGVQLNRLAQNAELVLQSSSLAALNSSKRLGKVEFDLTPHKKSLELVQPARVEWKTSTSTELSQAEEKLSSLVQQIHSGLKLNPKMKADLVKTTTIGLDQCKKLKTSFSSDISSALLAILIDAKQWNTVGSLLCYSHPRSLAHCPGVALELAEKHRFGDLFALLKHGSDISAQELASVLKTLIICPGPEADTELERYHSQLSTYANQAIANLEKLSKKKNSDTGLAMEKASLAAATINGFSRNQLACHALMGLYPNPILLCTAMKSLHSHYLIYLIRYLLQWFNNLTEMDVASGGTLSDVSINVPTLNCVLAWLTAAVDAGNLRLASNESGVATLQGLLHDLQEQISSLKNLKTLGGILEQIQKLPAPVKRHGPQGYTVQCLSL